MPAHRAENGLTAVAQHLHGPERAEVVVALVVEGVVKRGRGVPDLLVQLTKEEAEQLELERGQIVYVRPSRETVFTP